MYPKTSFYWNLLKFVLGCIPSFGDKVAAMKDKVEETLSNTKWYFSTFVPIKTLKTHHQYKLSLRHMAETLI